MPVGYPDNRGKGSAVREAIAASEGDIVMYLDCDLAYGTDVVPEVIRKMKESDYDIIIGSRNLTDDGYEGYAPIRKLASKTYIKVLNLCAGFHMSDSAVRIQDLPRRYSEKDILILQDRRIRIRHRSDNDRRKNEAQHRRDPGQDNKSPRFKDKRGA